MRLNKILKKFSFIFTMLVAILILFCIDKNDSVYAAGTSTDYVANSIIDFTTNNDLPDGNYNVTVVGINSDGESETIIYPVELINYYEDVTYTTDDATNGIIELGDDTDEYKMLIVKYHKNLTIEKDVTLTANTHTTEVNGRNYELTYKKGMYIYVNRTLTNNGTISMTARGTYNQAGENVYLSKNDDGSFEYVPAVGGLGGEGVSGNGGKVGNNGIDGIKRQTGGGGSGRIAIQSSPAPTKTTGSGSAGTSYSGGSGSAPIFGNASGTGEDASPNGGKGGDATINASYADYIMGGGAGNPGGRGKKYRTYDSAYDGETGTGGLLVISAYNVFNNSAINSTGSKGGTASGQVFGGAGSGGGSINIFYKRTYSNEGTVNANGGASGKSYVVDPNSGYGGNGTITVSELSGKPILTQLKVNNIDVPNFSSNKKDYEITLDKNYASFSITAIANDENINIEGIGQYNIEPYGIKVIDIILTDSEGWTNIYTIKVNNSPAKKYSGILKWAEENNLPDGNYNVTVVGVNSEGESETIIYPVELVNYYEDVTYTTADATNGIIELGDDTDEYKMLIVKYHKNLTIEKDVTLTANTHTTEVNGRNYELTYKKGMYIHVVGTLTNNGTISMTARGTYNQAGENVYLLENGDGSFEYVPAVGGLGGEGVSGNGGKVGNDGADGIKRQTGGGGSGRIAIQSSPAPTKTSGSGSAGTSYSGGSGSAPIFGNASGTGEDASPNGGKGGDATINASNSTYIMGGGAGNPGGKGKIYKTYDSAYDGETGTGGLLIIYGYNVLNNSAINSTGSKGGTASGQVFGGAGSGGGSINIFYKGTYSNEGTVNANGGASGKSYVADPNSGYGGNGTATFTMLYDEPLLTQLKVNDVNVSDFNSYKNDYEIILNKYDINFSIDALANNESISIEGLGQYTIKPNETKIINILLTNAGGFTNIYMVKVINPSIDEHSSKLSRLEIQNYENNLEPKFHPLTTEYTMEIPNTEIDLNIITETFDSEATVKIEGNRYIKNNTGIIKITVSESNVEDTIYTINYTKINIESEYIFDYTGNEQTFVIPVTGKYKLETWGAQGGSYNETYHGGYGGYSVGIYDGKKDEKLYINIGGVGSCAYAGGLTSKKSLGGYNGGGDSLYITSDTTSSNTSCSGGGATHIATVSGLLSELEAYKGIYSDERGTYNSSKILIVSGAGGGSTYAKNSAARWIASGGNGGGIEGSIYSLDSTDTGHTKYYASATPTTQLKGGSMYYDGSAKNNVIEYRNSAFGKGGSELGSGGGAGLYGGSGWVYSIGGSGFIGSSRLISYNDVTKSMYCYDCVESDKTETKTISTTNFSEEPISEYAKMGNGYAKITPLNSKSNDNYLTELTSNYGTLSPSFDPKINEYTLTLDKYTSNFILSGTLSDEKATVTGLDEYSIEFGKTKTIDIVVISESGDLRNYTVIAARESLKPGEHLSKLSKLEVQNYENGLEPKFHPLTTEYTIEIPNTEIDLNIITETFDSEATIKVEGSKYIKNDTGIITITVSEPNVEDTIYKINYTKIQLESKYEFNYTGKIQEYVVPVTGIYKLETWGAQGGSANSYRGGYGGYSTGTVKLSTGEILYIVVGGTGSSSNSSGAKKVAGGYNGGGYGYQSSYSTLRAAGGGGATHIAKKTGLLSTLESSVESILIVSGGGAGGYGYSNKWWTGNNGGGYHGGYSYSISMAGTQTDGYAFGQASDTSTKIEYTDSNHSGGGGGFYGGHGIWGESGSGGGSGYIGNPILTNKSMYCYSCKESSEEGTKTISTTNVSSNPISEYAKSGNGYAVITPSNLKSKDNYLTNIIASKDGKYFDLSPAFDPTIEEYTIELGVDDTKIKLEARPSSDLATIEGLGIHDVPSGKTIFPISVTSESGDIRIYNVKVKRPASSESRLNNIEITGLVPNICSKYNEYCQLDTEFNEDKHVYYMTVPAGIRDLEFTVSNKHDYQTITGDGVTKLNGGDNIITIEVISEDKSSTSTYRYEIYRDMTGNNYIDNIEFVNPKLDIGFNYLLTEYAFKVENSVTSLDMNITLDDENASYKVIGNENFKVGSNIVTIEVTAANGEIRNYILDVYRVSNSNNLLSNLEVKNGETIYTLSPEFEDIKTNYTLNVGNEVEKVTINATSQVETTTITGTGEKTLKVGLNQFKVITTAENGDIETYTIIITRAKNSNNYLSSLTFTEGTFNETFDKDLNTYTVTVNPYIKSLTINATPEVETSKVNISGNSNFKIGENIVKITVTAESGDKREYYIKVTKEGSDINYLSSLSVNQGILTPEFNKETLEYNIEVENSVSSITVSGEKEDILSKVEGLGTYRLNSGENTITVRVTSETGKPRDYVIKITRKYNDDASLKDITLSSGTLSPEFSKETLEYTVNVENEIEKLTVKGTPNVSTTTVSGNGTYNLEVGNNEIILNTTSESGITKTYKINVIRDISSNANLSSLIVKEGIISPTFDKMVLNYRVKVPNKVEKVNVIYEKERETSTVTVTGTENLVVGENTVNVIVTAEDGSIKTYEIIVERQEETVSNLNLRTLDVTSCTLNPEFSGETTYYECEVAYEVKSVEVSAQLEDKNNTLSGTGTHNLNVGKNTLGVKVTDKDLQEKSYQVIVTRKESTESRLSNIEIKNHTLDKNFDKDTFEYNIITQDDSLEFIFTKLMEEETVEVQGNENFTLGLNTVKIKVTSQDKAHESIYIVNVTKEKSDNNYLKSLEVEGYNITPTFNKGVLEYNLTVENEEVSIIVNAEKEKETSTVIGTGMHTLNKGANEVIVTVTSESGITREYKINVTRLGSRNSYLKSLGVKNEVITPTFTKENLNYTLEVEYEKESIEIQALAEEENAVITGDGINKLQRGINKLPVTVTSENGEIRTYYINVTRKDPVTSKLENISVKNYNLDKKFESNTLEYIVIVDNEVTSLDLIISKLDPKSTYVIEGNSNFEVGLNEVKIISTSSDGNESTTYILTVNRQAYSNTYLSSLSVSEGELNPEFEKTTLSYEVSVPYETEKINIEAYAENLTSTVEGTGEKTLKIGENTFNITVTSTGGIKRTYILNVKRTGSNNANIKEIRTNIGSLTKINDISYELTVPKDITNITKENVIVTLEDPYASYVKMDNLDLSESKEYKITVTSADKTKEKEYIIYVKYELSKDALIKELTSNIGELTPEFNSNKNDYILNVQDIATEVELNVVLNNEKSTLLNDNLIYQLEGYETKVELTVQAEDGTINTYNISIQKNITTQKYLQDIKITKVKEICETCVLPEYSETTYEYTLTVPYEVSEIGFEITKKHKNQEVTVLKNDQETAKYVLDVGENTFKVKVVNSLNEETIYTYKVERLKSTNNYLSSLKLINPEMEIEDFDKRKQEYNIKIPYEYENVTVEAVAEDEANAKVSINGTTYLIEGNNDIVITVTSASKEKREYIVHVLRTPESNNLLKALTISSGDIYELTPKFTEGITDYTLTVPGVINKVLVEGIPDEETSTVEGNGEYSLNTGMNEIKLIVTSKEGLKREYKVKITRESSKNVYLSRLEITNGILNETFQKEKGTYTASIANDKEKLDMIIETEDKEATYEVIGNNNLRYGENEVRIKVTSSDKSAAKTYVITVTKQGDPENRLESLKIDGELIEGFSPDITKYELEVENDKDSVYVEAIAKSKYARVNNAGYYSLQTGENIIVVTVIGQSGIIKNYEIKITRKTSAYLNDIVVDEGALSPTFDKKVLEYSVEVENDIKAITVLGLKEDPNATVTGNGKYNLEVGENEIVITVTGSDEKTTKEYKLIVTRKGNENTYLKYLTLTNGLLEPAFNKEQEEYTAYIPDDQEMLGLDYETEEETSISEVIGNETLSETESIVTIKVTSTSGAIRNYNIKVIKEEASLFSNKLLEIRTDKGTLSPRFDPDKQEYTLTIGNNETEVYISATRESLQSTVIGVGTHKIVEGRNVIQILVTSKDNKTRIYTIIVYRVQSNDARLEALEFNEGKLSPIFNKNVYNYTLKVESEVKSISIKKIVPVEKEATYEITGSMILTGETSVINVNVTSPDKSITKTYKINVRREKSSNAYLKSLTTNKGKLNEEFIKTENTYTMTVESDVSSIIVNAEAESQKAIVAGDGYYELSIGKNYINVTVTAENGSSNVYSIIIDKQKNTNNYLSDIYVSGYNFKEEYERERQEYTLEVENEIDTIDIKAIAEVSTTNIIGTGRKSLEVGENNFEVLSISENGDIRTYKVIVTRKKLISSKIRNLEVEEGVLNPKFNSDIYEYHINIPNEYRSLTMKIELEEEGLTPVIEGNSNFIVGENEVYIKVKASDNTESTYKINVTRQVNSNNYLKSLTIDKGTLSPTFEKGVLNYKAEVENEVGSILVSASPEANGSTVRGIGDYDLTVGKNEIVVEVTSESGVKRSYKIEVTRKGNSNNYLSNIIVSEGTLNPVFDKNTKDYEVKVPIGTESINIEAIAEEITTQVEGTGDYDITIGSKKITLLVTSEDGSVTDYNITVIRDADSNLTIKSITPSSGTLSPEFSNEKESYTVKVGSTVNIISFEVETESKTAKVSGNKDIVLNGLNNVATIIVTAEDGQQREITINIEKEASITGITVVDNNIVIVNEEEYQIQAKVSPDESVTVEYEYSVLDNRVVEVDAQGKILGKNVGTTTVEVKVKGLENIKTSIEVEVVRNKIESSIYEVKDIENNERIILGADQGEKIKDFIDKLENPKEMIEVYDKENTLVTDYEDIIKTGMRIKLVLKDRIYDECIIILRGDSNEDGLIDVTDRVQLQNHILAKEKVTGYRTYALDLEIDRIIDVSDNVKLSNYILRKISTLN